MPPGTASTRLVRSRLNSSVIQLRPYQVEFVDKIRDSFRRHRRVLAVAPTGSGKTVCFAFVTSGAVAKGNRVMIVAHRVEIVDQISSALSAMGVRHGRIQTGHSITDDPVQVAMVVTLGKRLDKIKKPRLLVIDECHHSAAGSWAKVSEEWSDAKILGVTATPIRLDGRPLGRHFDDLVVGPTVAGLINDRFLAPYTYLAPPQEIDLSAIKIRNGDYAVDELADAMNTATITGDAIEHGRRYLNGAPAIVFCVTIGHADAVARQFRDAGFRAASVDGTMDKITRKDRITAIGDGRLKILTSCALISEGTDIPAVAGAILLRPTQSLGLHLQQVGRCLRPKPDGSGAVILDHVGNVLRHGLPDAPRNWSLTKKQRAVTPGLLTCKVCYRVFMPKPLWKSQEVCNEGCPADCILLSAQKEEASGGRGAPEQVSGELVAITTRPTWANGRDIVSAPLRSVLDYADTPEKLGEIARARGYHHGWIKHIMRERDARDQ